MSRPALAPLFAAALLLHACGSGGDAPAVPDPDAPYGTEALRRNGDDDGAARGEGNAGQTNKSAAPYDFTEPAAAFALPAVLREISGLTLLDDEQLGAVQDEEGDLYAIRMADGEPLGRIRFARGGDYEALERLSDLIYVLQSDGDLFELRDWNRGRVPKTRNFETRLGAKACDAEGLGARGELLYISCKEEDADGLTRVYEFDPRNAVTRLHLTIDPDDVPGEGPLAVSALAFHPVSGHLVLLSSKRERLISVTPTGAVAEVWDFEDAKLEQPEGLAFLPNGDMYISSESKGAAGHIVRFDYAP